MQSSTVSEQLELAGSDTAVLHRVAQRFLRDPEQTEGGFFGDRVGDIAMNELDFASVLLRELSAQTLDGGNKTQVLELGGMKLMRQTMHVGGDVLGQPT